MARKANRENAPTDKMAVRARAGFFARIQNWIHEHPEETRIGLIFAAVAFVFTQGLPLWDSDYSTWLSQAQQGWGELLKRTILPITVDPGTWGYADHPLQALFYKVFYGVFGDWGMGWFVVKCLAFGGLCASLWHWMRRIHVESWVIACVLALFALSSNVVTSMIWHSDWSVYGQLVLVLTLFWSLHRVERGPASRAVYRKGWAGLPADFKRFLWTFFACVYFGTKLHADVRLAPVVLLVWMWFFRREKFHVYLAPFGVTFAATLPWSSEFFKRLPPFVPGATGWQGTTYSAFSLGRLFHAIGGDVIHFGWGTQPVSWLAATGVFVVLAVLIYGGYRAYRDELHEPNEVWGFHLIWLAFTLLACAVAPASDGYTLRFFLMPLVPTTFLLAMTIHSATREFARFAHMKHVVMAIAVFQCVFNFAHAYDVRRNLGQRMVAVDELHRTVEQAYANSHFVYSPGFDDTGYKPASQAASITGRKELASIDDVAKLPAGDTLVASWGPSLDPKFTTVKYFSGCGSAIFDVLAPCSNWEARGTFLLKYLGSNADVERAVQLEGQGNFAAARQLLEGVWQKDHGNLGVGFEIGLDSYRLGDNARMEQIYDEIGPYLGSNVAVVYNWGLAKQGMQKFVEASKLLERAYSMAPKDYAIGFNLADTYYRQGRKSRALATLGELLQKYPDSARMKSVYENWQKQ